LIYIFRICAAAAIENMEEIKMPGTALITIDFSIQWVCARPAISLTIIRYTNYICLNVCVYRENASPL
jgi:hypothetical protein